MPTFTTEQTQVFKKHDGIKVRQNVELSVIAAYFLLVQLGQQGGGAGEGVTNESEGYRGLVQHGGSPSWLEESDPAGCDGRSMLPAVRNYTTCLCLWLIYY